jgi:hypothetical protein
VESKEAAPAQSAFADPTSAGDVHALRLGCRRCLQPLGNAVPNRCPECGLAIDPSDPRSVCDLRNRRHRVELMVAFVAGVAVAGLLAFGWWFGLMKLNQWMPMLNLVAPVVGLAVVPAVLCAQLARARPAIAYAIGSWSFVGWSLLAIAIDQLWRGVPISGLEIDIRGTLLVGAPVVALVIAIGLGIGGLLRVMRRPARPRA